MLSFIYFNTLLDMSFAYSIYHDCIFCGLYLFCFCIVQLADLYFSNSFVFFYIVLKLKMDELDMP